MCLGLLQRKIAVNSTDPRAASIIFNVSAAVISLILFVIGGSINNFRLPTNPVAYVFLFIACLFYALYERYRFYVAKLLDASLLSIVSNFGVMIAFITAIFLYSESVTLNKLIGMFLIIGALVLISFKKGTKATARGIFLALLVETIIGIAWSLDKKGALFFNYDTYNIMVWSLPLVFIYFFPKIKFAAIKKELKTSSWSLVLMAGLNVAGYLLQLKAVTMADATEVIPIVQTYSLFTVLAGVLILKERENIGKKIFAGVLAIVGVFLLVFHL